MPKLNVIQGQRDQLEKQLVEAIFSPPSPELSQKIEGLLAVLSKRGDLKAVNMKNARK
jgi:hypothetical protein